VAACIGSKGVDVTADFACYSKRWRKATGAVLGEANVLRINHLPTRVIRPSAALALRQDTKQHVDGVGGYRSRFPTRLPGDP
jgi:hypothetical protein